MGPRQARPQSTPGAAARRQREVGACLQCLAEMRRSPSPNCKGSRRPDFYQVFVAVLREGLLLLVFVLGPAVGDHVVHDGRVVDGLRLAPGHLQRRLVQGLHLHVDGRGAAD